MRIYNDKGGIYISGTRVPVMERRRKRRRKRERGDGRKIEERSGAEGWDGMADPFTSDPTVKSGPL